MPDARQHLLNTHAEQIRDEGACTVSIIAEWPDGTHKTTVLIMDKTGKNLDPWSKQRVVKKSRRHSEEKLDRLVEIIRKA